MYQHVSNSCADFLQAKLGTQMDTDSPTPEHPVGWDKNWAACPFFLAWRCCSALGGPSSGCCVAGSTGGAGEAKGKRDKAAARVVGVAGAWTGVLNWPLVFVFFLGEGGGDFLHGTDIGSGVFFMAKVTFFPLPFTPLRVTSPGGLAESSWPVRSTRKYIPCEFFLFCTGTHPFSGKEGTKRPTLPYGFFLPHKVLVRHPFLRTWAKMCGSK